MKNIRISDITLRSGAENYSFREKIEIAEQLARIGVDVIEVAPLANLKSDVLFLHTVAPMMGESFICCPVEWEDASIDATWNALKDAKHARLQVGLFTSPVGMEYHTHKKPRAIFEQLPTVIAKCKSLCADVELRCEDATRAEPEFLQKLIAMAIEAGVTTVTVCDTAGILLPQEMEQFIASLKNSVPALSKVTLSVECSEELNLATACAVAAVSAGAEEVHCAVAGAAVTSLTSFAALLRSKGESMGITSTVDQTAVAHVATGIREMVAAKESGTVLRGVAKTEDHPGEFMLSAEDDCETVFTYIRKLGYTLSDEDLDVVYENFCRLAAKKQIGAKELEAIIATTAMQVVPTYVVKSYLANSGNLISSTAHVVLEKNGTECHGISIGDGPIDAAFRAIEQVTGHHFELDDFQIRAITEGLEAVGEAVVKLRADGKLYSGCGVSTDIIGASVHAYVNALNKICHEEAEQG